MILRYQKFIQRLNNIQKVCILHNMLMDGLSLVRAPAATLAWRRDVASIRTRLRNPLAGVGVAQSSLYVQIPVATEHEKARLLAQCYPSQAGRGWFDDEALAIEKSVLHSGSDYSVN